MICLTGHGTKSRHLPEEPLLNLHALALCVRIELSGLAAEILKDRAGFEDRDRAATGTIGIDDRRNAIVRRNFEEFRLELLALADCDRLHHVREHALLQHDADLPAIWC